MNTPAILTDDQRSVLAALAEQPDLAAEYTLSGGTALAAFHLHHRRSDDLDFFTINPVDALRVRRFVDDVRSRLHMEHIEGSRLYDRHIFLLLGPGERQLKLEFTQYPYRHLESPAMIDGVRVEGVRDIAADKLAALLDRFEPKDYYDLYVLLRNNQTRLARTREDAERKFHLRIDPVQLGAAFARSRTIPILPHLLVPITQEEVQQFFADLARGLRGEVMEE